MGLPSIDRVNQASAAGSSASSATLRAVARGLGLIVVALAAAATVACGDTTRELLGQGKRSPDEFAVYSRTPLSLPPDYGLRPPGTTAPGISAPGSPTADARDALIGRGAGGSTVAAASAGPETSAYSSGTRALLDRTGGLEADPAIRRVINEETSILADADRSFTDRLMFWREDNPYGTVVDADAEARRIRENQALGQPVTAGRTPTIERRQRALLEGILN
jgi:hypothetical protein